MQEKHLFEYAVIRLVPCVEREEFMNVGVILYCPSLNFLRTGIALNEVKFNAFNCESPISEIREHLSAFEKISIGGEHSGPIGQLPIGSRFRWLTAPRSTIVQVSSVHTGLCRNADETLADLLEKLVR